MAPANWKINEKLTSKKIFFNDVHSIGTIFAIYESILIDISGTPGLDLAVAQIVMS